MLVKIDESTALEMLMERVSYWTDDATIQELYEKMYESYVYGGVFDNGEFNTMEIVDNDYINWCSVIEEGDEAYKGIKQLYERDGISDISCEKELNGGYSFIEAECDGLFLVRY
jgi:hypothetical protein